MTVEIAKLSSAPRQIVVASATESGLSGSYTAACEASAKRTS
jgi:hypothetical protein